MVYRLSDSFAINTDSEQQPLELVVTAYNVNAGYNEDITKKDANLYGYVTFLSRVRKNGQSGMTREQAMLAAIQSRIKDGVLAEYLENNASEVINMLFGEWNWDDAKAVWDEETESRVDKKWEAVVADKNNVIAGKDIVIADRDKVIADKNFLIADKDAEIAALKTQLKINGSNTHNETHPINP